MIRSTMVAALIAALAFTNSLQPQYENVLPQQPEALPPQNEACIASIDQGNAATLLETGKPLEADKSLIEAFSFQQAVEQADLIVKVQITKCSAELEQPSPKTLWQADVLTVWKGESAVEQVYILQDGNSSGNYHHNKMLEPGEQYVLFLKQAVSIQQPDSYWILGGETTIYQVTEDGYIVKHAMPQQELADIEQRELTGHYMKTLDLAKQIQVLAEQPFYDKMATYLESLN